VARARDRKTHIPSLSVSAAGGKRGGELDRVEGSLSEAEMVGVKIAVSGPVKPGGEV
jgi:hypothetical protein